ncbi:conjugal transfer protein TraD [Legionella pneumophila]|uniref:conjugal transfer protein TraD n=2 Tax=Legionella pneumophila TaxID=446 RepID=UPI0001E3C3EF|nr:conjugal transfer protein TraD [Legionella pneumophila]TIE23138.1 conjugal transfer protein TraD [Legionella pneumophila]TIE28384.1 conjugal transfer protein TraD [Legionella pneumophila]TIE43930.1 conjugal transfer protein TraD [Legionella pneumophila]WBV70677.1 conjugal transfer protein TraD [Legionella pneumophila]CZO90189.1 conjugal transfer protein TraD [Legionella pneumophila]
MDTCKQIKMQKQLITRDEKALAIVKLKKRKADTRRKIELGGLVIKAGMNDLNKSVILGALEYAKSLIESDNTYKKIFESKGDLAFYG